MESRQLDFGNWIKQDLMARERGKVGSPRMKSDTEEEWGPHAASVPVKAHVPVMRLEHDGPERPICPARRSMSKRVRIFRLWRYSAHDSSCRTM